jgi:hypothetical protein
MTRIIFVLCSLSLAIATDAQLAGTQTMNAGGGSAQKGSLTLEWSIGEMTAVQTLQTPGIILTQGVLQPSLIVISPLPVKLLYFTGETNDIKNVLSWATAEEVNNSYFEVERSSDGTIFQSLEKVEAAGNSSTTVTYNLIDPFPYTVSYYRLKQVDIDGKINYSRVVKLQLNSQHKLSIYPNPVSKTLYFSSPTGSISMQLLIFDASGKQVIQKTVTSGINSTIDVYHLVKGVYFIKTFDREGRAIWSGQFIKL